VIDEEIAGEEGEGNGGFIINKENAKQIIEKW
jgi:hypothetical protein